MSASKIRVLLLTDEMEVGGTQRQILYIAKQLDRARFEPTVLFFREPSFFVDELTRARVKVIQVVKHGRFDLGFVWRLRAVLQRERFDVMHCFAFSGELWGAVVRRLLPAAQRPVLITSVRGVYVWYAAWQWRFKKWVSGQSQCVVANSRMGAQYACERMGWPESAMQVIYNGVQVDAPDKAAARAVRAQLQVGDDGVLVLFVGRLVEIKDVPTLLRAMARLQHRMPALVLAIAGQGPMQTALLAQAQALQGRVHFLGQRDDVSTLMAACDVVVLPSVREGLSNVILEAMMSARAVVASRAGGNVELLAHQDTGWLFEVGDDAALAQALERLAQEAPLRAQLGQRACAHAQAQFSTPAMVHNYEAQYGAALMAASSLKNK